jgi:hypothetical protein
VADTAKIWLVEAITTLLSRNWTVPAGTVWLGGCTTIEALKVTGWPGSEVWPGDGDVSAIDVFAARTCMVRALLVDDAKFASPEYTAVI